MTSTLRRMSLLCLLAVAGASAAEPPPAGHVALVAGHGTALGADGATIRELRKDDPLYSGEVISAAASSYVNMRFNDGAFVLLRPNTRFAIEAYHGPATASPAAPPVVPAKPDTTVAPSTARTAAAPVPAQAFFRLLKGGLRAVSGLIGKVDHDEYRMSTPVATIGIRGTDYYVYQCDATCGNDPVIAELVGSGKLPANIEGGTLVGVYKGAVRVESYTGQSQLVQAGQFLLTLPDGSQIFLPVEPLFLRITPFPDPTTLCADQ